MSLNEQIAADLSTFVDTDNGFAVTATVGGESVSGIFDHEYVEVMNAEGEYPVLTCVTTDVSGASQGTAVVVNGTSYTVASVQPDGTGMTRLALREV